MEREVLWRIAPHIIWPLRFVLPHHKGLRPGLAAAPRPVPLRPPRRPQAPAADPHARPATRPRRQAAEAGEFTRGFEYSDCWVEDARLVVLNARDAADRGADHPHPHQGCVAPSATATAGRLTLRGRDSGARRRRSGARLVVNAAGPWVADVLGRRAAQQHRRPRSGWSRAAISWCRKLYDHDRCYIFQNADSRIVFAIPYERDFTLIGTTDRDYQGDPADVAATDGGDRLSLRRAPSEYFAKPVTPRRRRLDLFRRAPALRRRRQRGAGGDARLRAGRSTRPAGAPLLSRLRRQDHHLSPARRARAGEARAAICRAGARRGAAGPARRRCRAAISRSTAFDALVAELARALSLPRRRPCAPAGPRLRHARRATILGGATALGRSRPRLRRRR